MTKEALNKVITGTKEERMFLCEHSYGLFAIYYFQQYFKYALASYHYDFFQDLHDLQEGKIREVAWIAFRESGKTSIAKLFIIWLIAFNKKKYINVDSFDKENSERILFDIAFEMVNNPRLKADFGTLFSKERSITDIKQNRINNFVTENGTRVEAHSTQESVRGRIHLNQRPDFLLLDDIETNKTKDSEAYTKQVRDHISEAMAGMSPDGSILYLGNFITEYGNIQFLFDRAKVDKGIRIRNIPVIIDGKLAWESKYAMTDIEATKTGKVSIEDKQRQLGSLVFSYEMMNKPIDELSAEFKREYAQPITEHEVSQKETSCYITIDSAVSEKESADFTGITINRVDRNNKWFIKTYRLKVNSKDLIDHLFFLEKTYSPQFIGLEETTFTMAIQPFLQDEMRKRNKHFSITPIKHRGQQKELRIRGLIPRWENKSIFLVGDNFDLLDEMRVFPNGQHDDCIAEGSLILTNKGEIPIENIKIGDYVMTRGGFQKVLRVWDKGELPVITNLITGTPEHRVITEQGEKYLIQLNESDILHIWNKHTQQIEKQSYTMVKDFIDTQNQKDINYDATFGNTTKITNRLNLYIDRFGLTTLEKYLKNSISIIKMVIILIIRLRIFNVFQQKNTQSIIHNHQKEDYEQASTQNKTIRFYKNPQKNGEIAKWVKNGIVSILKKVLISLKKLLVLNVAQKQLDIHKTANIAQVNAEIKSNLETTAKSIQISERKRVYDLAVENHHEFFVNGVLVHNCIDSLSMQLPIAKPPYYRPVDRSEYTKETNPAI